MTDADLAQLTKLADMLKLKGVRFFETHGAAGFAGGDVKLSFAAPEVPLKEGNAQQSDGCPCGHPLHGHINGLCVFGCEVEKCAGNRGGA